MHPKIRYIIWRLLLSIPAIFGIITFNFILLNMAPGDAADVLAGEAGAATPEFMAGLREQFGLNQPLYVQYVKYVWNIINLDLGYSFRFNAPVGNLIMQRLPATLLLMGTSLVLAVSFGILLGVIAARFVDTIVDYSTMLLSLLWYSVPTFWVGLMMIIMFSVNLGWLPSSGIETLGASYTGVDRFVDIAQHLLMPMVSLSLLYMGVYTRLMRASMLEVYGLDFVRTAHAKGLSPARVAFKHVLRNALFPVVTMAGLHVAGLLGGAVIVEVVFSWPGLGRLAVDAVFTRDYNLLLSILVLSSVLVIAVNIMVDILYTFLDPRVEAR